MVHNRREFWERHFDDAYELAYQTYVVSGLRDAAEMAPALGAEAQADGGRRKPTAFSKPCSRIPHALSCWMVT